MKILCVNVTCTVFEVIELNGSTVTEDTLAHAHQLMPVTLGNNALCPHAITKNCQTVQTVSIMYKRKAYSLQHLMKHNSIYRKDVIYLRK